LNQAKLELQFAHQRTVSMSFETLDEANSAFKSLEDRLNSLETENAKLKATKEGLQGDLKKRKQIATFLKVAGIELTPEMSDEEIAERVLALKAAGAGEGDEEEGGAQSSSSQAGQQQPQGGQQQPPAQQGYAVPSDAVDTVVKAEMASLKRRLEEQNKRILQAEQERDRERESRRATLLEQKVMDELARADCRKPAHLFKLKREDFRLLEDEETVVYGPQDDPASLKDAVSKLREDEDYSIYFNGSGATGSGMAPSRAPSYTSANNPFAVGSVNATLVAQMLNSGQKEKASRLFREARAAGKLDPRMASAMSEALG
jgi:hypothetical protein